VAEAITESGFVLPGGSTTNNPQVVELARECLRGGHVIRVQNGHEAQRAQALGAVGVLCRPPIDQRTPAGILQILEHISILPMCLLEDLDVFISGYKLLHGDQGPGFFVICALSEAQHQQINNVLAYVDELVEIPENRHLPVFINCRSLEEARQAMRSGADGTILLLDHPLDDAAMQEFETWPAEAPRDWEKEPGERVIGIMALQGDYHLQKTLFEKALARLPNNEIRIRARLLRNPAEFMDADAIVLPGGWSNLVSRLLLRHRLHEIIRLLHDRGTPMLGICCGMILARSRNGQGCEDRLALGLIDIAVDNNAVSGEYLINLEGRHIGPARFVNAPIAVGALGPDVEVLARLEAPLQEVVGVRQENVLAFAFHEGVQDLFIHHCMAHWRSRATWSSDAGK
jgi:5'-phosphate synthase pdxT subunit